MILLILSPISLSPLSAAMSSKRAAFGDVDQAVRLAFYLSETYFTKSSVRM